MIFSTPSQSMATVFNVFILPIIMMKKLYNLKKHIEFLKSFSLTKNLSIHVLYILFRTWLKSQRKIRH